MAGINKAILIGNLGKDPEMRSTAGGQQVTTFSLATTERYSDKSGQRQEKTEWHSVVAWGKLAELANQYLKKGRSCYVEGKIQTRSWDDKDGNKKYKTEIVASQIQFLGGPGNSGNGDDAPSHGNASPAAMQSDHGPVAEEDLPF
ncbi:MAG: single-stranded DNA-binding protein [Chitinispirillaceae bacterium]|jgi:single-strand DNA-binding protein|nr:single-stranded DNA-binding protein [Chitinispirillaceae bacterium]